nr:DUF4421 family protein [uncultured Bacteroides sp.]
MKQEVRRVQDEEDAGAKGLRMWLFLLLLGVMPYAAAWGQEASEQEVVRQEASEYAESHSKGKLLMWLDHLFDKLSVSKSDTLYAVRNNYRFSIKPRMGISVGIFGFDWKQDGERQEYILNSAPVFKLGANFSYRNLTIGFQRDVERLFKGKQTNNAEFGASLYGTMLGGDYFYSSSNRYTIRSEQDKEWHLRVSVRDVYRPMDTGYSTITVSPIPPSSRRVISRSGVAVASSWGFRCMLSSSNWIPMRCPIIGRSSACLDASYGFHFQACTPEVSGIYRTSVSGQSKCGRNSPFGSAVGSVAQLCRIHDCH